MSFVIKNGLFQSNITDYHAILGVSLDADAKEIRLKYLKIAQLLHPDRCKSDVIRKELASEILSKLVNPAYEHLSRKNSFAEHQLILTQIGKRLAEKKDTLNVIGKPARELLKAGDQLQLVYLDLLQNLSEQEYQYLEKITDNIELISELNLVYLTLKQERLVTPSSPQNKTPSEIKPTTKTQSKPSPQPTPQSNAVSTSSDANNNNEEPTIQDRIAAYIRRANEYIAHGSYTQAIAELKYALKLDPNHSICHALMGKAYLQQQQVTMARVHINKAYNADNRDPIIIELKKQLDKLDSSRSKIDPANKTKSSGTTKDKSETKSTNSGIFGSLFGTKKK
jgi:curved DNA-binding protein CbpA